MSKIQIVDRAERDALGEGPVWSSRLSSLFWVDIVGQKIHRLHLPTGSISTWPVPVPIGWILERRTEEGFIAGLKTGFAFVWLDPFRIETIGNPETDRHHNRLNDAKVDRWGRIWAGSKDDRDQEVSGALYRLDANLTWSRQDDGYSVANGPTFSLDHHTMFHTDSGARVVYAFDLGEDGTLCRRRVWLRFHEEWGYPDGMTTDAEGGIWIAHWGGARVSRFSPDGTLDHSIALPASNITSIAFAGNDLRRMFVTSATLGSEGEPTAGALFELDAGVQGIAPYNFAG